MAVTRVRPEAVADAFYPADPARLVAMVDGYVADAASTPAVRAAGRPKAVVVPHAGYVYSGPTAGFSYAAVRDGGYERAVVIGPAHYVYLDGVAISSADAWATPLGAVCVDAELRERALAIPGVVVDDAPHAPEHSLEVQLPFLVRVLGLDVPALPLVVGHAPSALVEQVLDALWGGPETLVVVSTDLSHYLDHATAAARDRRTADAIVAARGDAIGDRDACGAYALRPFLAVARRRGLVIDELDVRSSGDTAGPRDRVVGYGAFAAHEAIQ